MTFLSPLMFWGMLAAGIPVALHFFYRSRYRVVPWAAMEFLLTSIQQTTRRLRFQELLLLLLRVALLVLLAFALTRPAFTGGTGGGRSEAIDAVFVFDTSYSMGVREGTKTRLDQAKVAAHRVLDGLPAASTVQIIGSADRATALGSASPTNLDQARQVIDSLQITALATDFTPAASEALEALKRGHLLNREVYLFSDMQKLGWEQQAAAVRARFGVLHEKAQVYLVRCGTHRPRNATIIGIRPQTEWGLPHTGERATFTVLLRNYGNEPVRDLTVTLEIDGRAADRDSRTVAVLEPGQTQAVPLTGKLLRAGLQTVTATVGPDDLDGDNRFDLVIMVRDRVRILVIDGAPNERDPTKAGSYFLLQGLLSVPESKVADYLIQPRVTTPRQASASMLADKDVCILVNVPLGPDLANEDGHLSPEFPDRLAGFVRDGHGLLIFAGPHVHPRAYNELLYDRHRLLPTKLGTAYDPPRSAQVHADPASIRPNSFLASLAELVVQWPLLLKAMDAAEPSSDDAKIVLRWTNGKPALLSRQVGAGEVILCTTSAQTDWSEWPTGPTWPPFINVIVGQLVEGSVSRHNLRAGERFTWQPRAYEESAGHILTLPGGEAVRLGVAQTSTGRPLLTFADTVRAGIYRITADSSAADKDRVTRLEPEARSETPGTVFAVTPDLRESADLDSLSDREIDELLGFQPIHLTAGREAESLASDRLSHEWTTWLLAVVLGLVVLETAFAWICGRSW
jgi:hypothetical protein